MPAYVTAAVLRHLRDIMHATPLAPWAAGLDLHGSAIALALVFALHHFPLILLSLAIGLAATDRSLSESARNLGASRFTAWHRITLPLAAPAYTLGLTLVLLRILEDAGTPLMLGMDHLLAPQIVVRVADSGLADPLLTAAALVLLTLAVLVVALAWSALLPPGDRYWRRPGAPGDLRHSAGAWDLLAGAAALAAGLIALAPLLGLLVMSLGQNGPTTPLPAAITTLAYQDLLATPRGNLGPTLVYAAASATFTLLLGTLGALSVSAASPAARLARFAVACLFAVPGVVLALAYRHLSVQADGGSVAWPGAGWTALVLVVALKQLPFATTFVAIRLRSLLRGGLASARNLGAAGTRLVLGVALRSLAGTLIAVFLLAFAAAAAELTAAMVLLDGTQGPLAVTVFESLHDPDTTAAGAALAILQVTAIALALWFGLRLLRPHYRRAPPCLQRPIETEETPYDEQRAVQP